MAGEHQLLSLEHIDSIADKVQRGDLIVGQGAPPYWRRLAIGSNSSVLTSDGTDLYWGSVAAATTPAAGRAASTTVDTSTSSTFADAAGMSITITTGARRVLLTFHAYTYWDTSASTIALTFTVDGTTVEAGADLAQEGPDGTANYAHPIAMQYLTDSLSAASHTFKVQLRRVGGTGNVNMQSKYFSAVEIT